MKTYEVVAGVIIHKGKFLCMQRSKGKFDYISYKYEFPGGKIEIGESRVDALKRELIEEMDMKVEVHEDNLFMTVEHEYPDFKIIMHSYLCEIEKPEFKLKEHISFQWLRKNELRQLDWAEADLPIVFKLIGDQPNGNS